MFSCQNISKYVLISKFHIQARTKRGVGRSGAGVWAGRGGGCGGKKKINKKTKKIKKTKQIKINNLKLIGQNQRPNRFNNVSAKRQGGHGLFFVVGAGILVTARSAVFGSRT